MFRSQQKRFVEQHKQTPKQTPYAALSFLLTYIAFQAQALTMCAQTSDPVSKHTAVVVMLCQKHVQEGNPISPTSKSIATQASMSLEELFQGPRALSHVPASCIQNRVVKIVPAERYTKPKSKAILQQVQTPNFADVYTEQH
jgi:hypothetical protein